MNPKNAFGFYFSGANPVRSLITKSNEITIQLFDFKSETSNGANARFEPKTIGQASSLTNCIDKLYESGKMPDLLRTKRSILF